MHTVSDKEFENLEKVLGFLKTHSDKEFFPNEIANKIHLSIEKVTEIVENARLNQWVDDDHSTDDGIWAVKINTNGAKKYSRITGKPNYSLKNKDQTRKWALIGIIVTVVLAIISMLWSAYLPTLDKTTSDSSIILLDQKLVDCNKFPDGESGFHFVNKKLGYMISWPNQDWILTKDLEKHRNSYGLEVGSSFLGGTHIARETGFMVQVAVFDNSDPLKNDFDEWIRLQKEAYAQTLQNMISSNFTSPEKNSARLEIHGIINDAEFSMYERLLKYDGKIYLIQKHLMSPEKYPKDHSEQAESVRTSFTLLSNCNST